MKEKIIISGQVLLDELNRENWSELIPRLQYYSLNKLQRYPFLMDRFNINNLAVHFSDEAIKQIWLEERTWNINYYKDLYGLLKGVVDSLISNFLSSKEIEVTSAITEQEEDEIKSDSADAETDMIVEELETQIAAILNDDKEAYDVFQCLKDGLKPRQICTELNIDINEIYNILKRVDRKLSSIRLRLKS